MCGWKQTRWRWQKNEVRVLSLLLCVFLKIFILESAPSLDKRAKIPQHNPRTIRPLPPSR